MSILNVRSKSELYVGGFFSVLLLIGIYFLTSITFMGETKLNLLDVMGYVNSGRPDGGSGIYGLLLIIALFSPLAPAFFDKKNFYLVGFLPLIIILLVMWNIHHQISSMQEQAQGVMSAFTGESRSLENSFDGMINYGIGMYFNLIVSIILSFRTYIKLKNKS